MLHLKNVLKENLISLDLKSNNKKDVIRELLDLLVKDKLVTDQQLAFEDILSRENYLSTGMENGLAVPHAKSDTVNDLVMAFGLHKKGVNFDSLDGKPAHYIFLVLSPRDKSGPHIKALSIISRNIKAVTVRDALIKAQTPEEVINVFEN